MTPEKKAREKEEREKSFMDDPLNFLRRCVTIILSNGTLKNIRLTIFEKYFIF